MSLTIDSTNPRVMADNIRKLDDAVQAAASELPDVTDANTGDVLGLIGESKTKGWITPFTPPSFSETEVNTGYKWIDGKEIYCKVYVGDTQETTSAETIDTFTFNFVKSDYLLQAISGNWYKPGSGFHLLANDTTGVVSIDIGAASFYNRPYIAFLYYTKPDPVPGNREPDEEPETKKSTKRKITKKEEE